jgi:hypothetical protein
MVHVSSIIRRIKNQPSNSTTCSDNAPHLLIILVGESCWGLQVTSSFLIWGCIMKGCFEKGIFWRAKTCLKGIEDFNLEHCVGVLENQAIELRLSLLVFGVPVRAFERVTPLTLNERSLPLSLIPMVVPSLFSRTKRWICYYVLISWITLILFNNNVWKDVQTIQ